MVPRPPPREGQLGFVYAPPIRIQGISVAGEQTVVHIPEFDLVFDIGLCPRAALTASVVALSHAHMDHSGGIPYYFSQRVFQKLGPGRVVCHPEIAQPLRQMMRGWVDLERQRTPHEVEALDPGSTCRLRPNLLLKAIEVSHTVPSLGFAVIETRSKLKPELLSLPQDRLRELRMSGEEITRQVEIPLVAYTGDTEHGPFLYGEEFVRAPVVITECTFFEEDHRDRARTGKHLHVEDLRLLLDAWSAPDVIVIHVSRRTNLAFARERLAALCGPHASRVHLLMDHRANRARYERQVAEHGGGAALNAAGAEAAAPSVKGENAGAMEEDHAPTATDAAVEE